MHNGLERLAQDLRLAAAAGAWHSALALALALPDICCKAQGGVTYADWCQKYVEPHFVTPGLVTPMIIGHDIYALRNAYLHSGDDDMSQYRRRDDALLDRIVLTASSGVSGAGVRKFQHPREDSKARLALPVGDLCEQILKGVADWSSVVAADEGVRDRLDRILLIRPSSAGPDEAQLSVRVTV